ncbi:MAG: BA14K family protein [Caulobacteraceae bacterium]|nr:BA14K family protein [Caulobacteraceae bacterium]
MRVPASAFAVVLILTGALPAAAQNWEPRTRTWSSHGGYGFNGQADRPGDYRCDAYWDAGRTDCGAAWRDQRPFVRRYSSHQGYDSQPRHGHGGYGYGQGPTYSHDQSYGRYGGSGAYGHHSASEGVRYYGAYGRPDQVYPGSGYGGQVAGQYGVAGYRDTSRSAWCASRYRSYDPVSGYYRAYSGRLVFCG